MAKYIWDEKNKKAILEVDYIPSKSSIPPIFATMTDEQLIKYANKKNIDISRLRSRDSIIARLEKTEQGGV